MLTLPQASLRLGLRMADLAALMKLHRVETVRRGAVVYVPAQSYDRLRALTRVPVPA